MSQRHTAQQSDTAFGILATWLMREIHCDSTKENEITIHKCSMMCNDYFSYN